MDKNVNKTLKDDGKYHINLTHEINTYNMVAVVGERYWGKW